MPDFTPNPWMLEHYADKGEQPWEIYAWCIRDAIAKHGGLKKSDKRLGLKDKLAFMDLMNSVKDVVTINGHEFRYIGGEPVQETKVVDPEAV